MWTVVNVQDQNKVSGIKFDQRWYQTIIDVKQVYQLLKYADVSGMKLM